MDIKNSGKSGVFYVNKSVATIENRKYNEGVEGMILI